MSKPTKLSAELRNKLIEITMLIDEHETEPITDFDKLMLTPLRNVRKSLEQAMAAAILIERQEK